MIPDKIVRRYPPGCDDTLHYSRRIDGEDDTRGHCRETELSSLRRTAPSSSRRFRNKPFDLGAHTRVALIAGLNDDAPCLRWIRVCCVKAALLAGIDTDRRNERQLVETHRNTHARPSRSVALWWRWRPLVSGNRMLFCQHHAMESLHALGEKRSCSGNLVAMSTNCSLVAREEEAKQSQTYCKRATSELHKASPLYICH